MCAETHERKYDYNMAIKTISIPFIFDLDTFATDIIGTCMELKITFGQADELCGIGGGACGKFARREKPNFELDTFLAVCNGLDLNPTKYFVLR